MDLEFHPSEEIRKSSSPSKTDIKLDKNIKTTILKVLKSNQKQTMNGGVFTHEKLLNFGPNGGHLQWSRLGLLAPLLPIQWLQWCFQGREGRTCRRRKSRQPFNAWALNALHGDPPVEGRALLAPKVWAQTLNNHQLKNKLCRCRSDP